MFRVNSSARARCAQIAIVGAVALTALVGAPSSQAADALLPNTRTLFLSERFTPTAVRDPLAGAVLPEQMLVIRGEREGFQFVVNNPGGDLALNARVVGDSSLAREQAAGTISFELLRVGMINVPQGSTGMGTSGGLYADPLPPLRASNPAGLLSIPAGQWGGLVTLATVRTTAAAGTFGGTLELFTGTGQNETVYGRQAFSLDVRNAVMGGAAQPLMQNGDKGSMKTVFNVEGDAYWLQHEALRNGAQKGYPTAPDRMKQLVGLESFLDSRGVTTLEYPFATPAASGDYSCAYDSPGDVPAFSFVDQLKIRYFTGQSDIDPTRPAQPVRMAPNETSGCVPEDANSAFHPTVDKYRTPSIKQDDVLAPGAVGFYRKVGAAWRANGFYGRQTYVKNPFDEPSDVTPQMRYQMDTQVPLATKTLKAAFGTGAKVVLADWPRDNANKKICRLAAGHKSCTTLSGDTYSNKQQWDGKGTDDVDVWMGPFSRLFGRPSSPVLVKNYKVNRERQYADRQNGIKKLRGGREIWAYNFFTANRQSPQVTIDAPPTDSKLMYWVMAREGHTGIFISNVLLGWGAETKLQPNGLRRKGNPYEQATYFKHSVYGYAANWGTFLYPGYVPALGLNSDSDRNSEMARPVTSLRMETMRDGQEDANLVSMYRTRYGQAKVDATMKPIFPGRYVQLPKTLGQVMFPYYDNGNNLALRLETQRRAMINALSQ